MASRLNAKEAAALTEQRAREIEARAKQAELDKKLIASQATKFARLWKAQGNRLIEAALNGRSFLNVGSKLIGGDQLIKLGFAIAYIDQTAFSEYQKELENEKSDKHEAEARVLEERENAKKLELKKLQPDIDKKIADFIKLVEKEDRYKGMDSTRKMVIKHFLEEINDYRNNISAGYSSSDKLFFQLFNSQLFVYKPIDSLRPTVQVLQDALHKLEKILHDLPEFEVDEFDYLQYDPVEDDEDSNAEGLTIDDFKRYLDAWECSESMEIDVATDYYQIEWSNLDDVEDWQFEDLISAAALAWLCGASGQSLLEAIESEIQDAIDSASSSIHISMEWDGEQCTSDIGKETYYYTPRSNQLSEILKILKYKINKHSLENGKSMLEISW
jgi:hypothetical protein